MASAAQGAALIIIIIIVASELRKEQKLVVPRKGPRASSDRCQNAWKGDAVVMAWLEGSQGRPELPAVRPSTRKREAPPARAHWQGSASLTRRTAILGGLTAGWYPAPAEPIRQATRLISFLPRRL